MPRRSLQDEDAALSVKVPLPINRLCRVRQWLSEKVTALDAEQAALEGKQMVGCMTGLGFHSIERSAKQAVAGWVQDFRTPRGLLCPQCRATLFVCLAGPAEG
jgi:hypothetical protein